MCIDLRVLKTEVEGRYSEEKAEEWCRKLNEQIDIPTGGFKVVEEE